MVSKGLTFPCNHSSHQGLLPAHCSAAHGLTLAIETLLACDQEGALREGLVEVGGTETEVRLVLYVSYFKLYIKQFTLIPGCIMSTIHPQNCSTNHAMKPLTG